MICELCAPAPCTCSSSFQQLTFDQLKATLPQQLLPCIDEIRSLKTCLGINVYSVRLVWIKWSGQVRGRGIPSILKIIDILPNPKVSPFTSRSRSIESIGVIEQGDTTVEEISLRYDEQQLTGQLEDGPVDADTEFFWEIAFPRPSGEARRRRFTVASAPAYDPGKMQWVIRLQSSDSPRLPNGDIDE
jgi:hypothetical protein